MAFPQTAPHQTNISLNVTFSAQHGATCWLMSATMVRSYFGNPTFAHPGLKGFGASGLDISKDGLLDAYLELYQLHGVENQVDDLEEVCALLGKYGPLWAITGDLRHAVVITGTKRSNAGDVIFYHDSAVGPDQGMTLAEFQGHPLLARFNDEVAMSEESRALLHGNL